jgi:hypothetical protein
MSVICIAARSMAWAGATRIPQCWLQRMKTLNGDGRLIAKGKNESLPVVGEGMIFDQRTARTSPTAPDRHRLPTYPLTGSVLGTGDRGWQRCAW